MNIWCDICKDSANWTITIEGQKVCMHCFDKHFDGQDEESWEEIINNIK